MRNRNSTYSFRFLVWLTLVSCLIYLVKTSEADRYEIEKTDSEIDEKDSGATDLLEDGEDEQDSGDDSLSKLDPEDPECGQFILTKHSSNGVIMNNNTSEDRQKQRLIFGHEARMGEFPFYVRLSLKMKEENRSFTCGGVIIDRRHILTAAHCLVRQIVSYPRYIHTFYNEIKLLQIGNNHLGKDHSDVKIVGYKMFPQSMFVDSSNFNRDYFNDIAILRTNKRLKFSLDTVDGSKSINKVCLPPYNKIYYQNGIPVVAIGMGVQDLDGNSPKSLQRLKLLLTDYLDCKLFVGDRLDLKSYVTSSDVCTGVNYELTGNICFGDSGGPLIRLVEKNRWELVGINSRMLISCIRGGALYTRVANFLSWIMKMVRSSSMDKLPM